MTDEAHRTAMNRATNGAAWAIGRPQRNGFHVRCIRWGLLAAQAEQREGEEVRAANITVERQFKPRRSVMIWETWRAPSR